MQNRRIVVFIGSTKFQETFLEEAWRYTHNGWIVLLPNFRPESMMGDEFDIPIEDLEDIGYNKIKIADLVYVINKEGYIGSSTSKEIEFAEKINKPIEYMVKVND